MATDVTLTLDGSDMRVFVDVPAGPGPHPALVVAHHRGNMDSFTTKFVQDLASEGFAAAAPFLFHRRPEGEDSMVSIKNLDDAEIVADLSATLEHLQSLDAVDANRVGIVGHCMGGRVSFLGASSIPAFKTCAVFYGGNMFVPWGKSDTPPFNLLGNLKGPVIGFFGKDDKNPSPEDVAKIGVELDRLGVKREFHSYDGCGHAFQNFVNPAGYRPAATRDSQAKLLAWLRANL